MDFLQAFILGVVEGLTEFLPISSTGHLILTTEFLGISPTEFVKTFEIAIQSGAILAVIFIYRKTLINDFELVKRVFLAFIPTAILGILAYSHIKAYLLGNPPVVLWALFIGGIALIVIELFLKNKSVRESKITYEKSIVIGLFQALSMVPGVSRAAASIFGGMIVGLSRKQAVEFSFLLAIPTIFGATFLDLKETNLTFDAHQITLLSIGIAVSFAVSILAIKWLLKYIANHNFIWFGVYRIILSILYFLFILN